MPVAACPECDAEIHVDDDTDKGEFLFCEECDARLEVVGLDPIQLDLSSEIEDEEEYDDEKDY